ncbi:MAG: phosphoribosylanthranilate isomerase [Pyrinomonadaceae bacterium]
MAEIKICGITNLEDALLCVQLGADTLGFNFYPASPRYIDPKNARVIVEQMPVNILNVGVFVNADAETIQAAAETAGLGAVQLHGDETPAFARDLRERLKLPVIKAFRVSKDFTPEDVRQFDVDAVLLDTFSPTMHGGTGETFDWNTARKVRKIFPRMYLAGGISPENVHLAISEVDPFAIDACSSLESSPGKKDPRRLHLFIEEAKRNG